ncbi:glycosyltransferase [Rhizobium rhizoryzae]|uniref:Glycosyltransferase involved in cell wall biosynthesis n=1 Tax=Rhizobium rhizoryzae TaxID=451876 RepID=A0A7W6LL42_9HYPH|nr:glycosyltransferase [Rhizobium rhizoryzae]MBB4146226.1 glycosyltransferase involved in cell wall biosynthesis [Rhizobium rhizoryzae]
MSKVALVHYWLVGMRGGEKVLEVLCELFPDADVYTLVLDRENISDVINKHKIHTSFLQKIGGRKHYQKFLPLMPFALEAFDLTSYDLVISSEAGPAKAVVTRPDALHICYCHSPMRYIWDLYPQYYSKAGILSKLLMSIAAPILRQWDVTTSARVDHFVANSSYVAKRIEKYYRRHAAVIHPPVDVKRFSISEEVHDFYICAGQITPYKRLDIAVDAFSQMQLPLIVIGRGVTPELRRNAASNVKFIEDANDALLEYYFARCRALVFPGLEDFGIIPLEVMASGRPVVAYQAGGALETVIDGVTGLHFKEQTVESLIQAVRLMEERHSMFDASQIRQHALSFDREIFFHSISEYIERKIVEHHEGKSSF